MRILACLFFFVTYSMCSQGLSLPLKSDVSLAGNYGELRNNHFHMGLDFKTNNRENYPVFAVDDGYVSRILISANGYGKCIYINHPKLAITSVYAHLNSFNSEVESWADHVQYALQKNSLDSILIPGTIRIKKGQQIALSGNTGSSSAPHLHFEIRNMVTEKTINPLWFYPQIGDRQPPKINQIALYKIVNGVSVFLQTIHPKAHEIIVGNSTIGIAPSLRDWLNSGANTMGIYQIKLYENKQLKYELRFDSLDFRWQGHIKSMSDYSLPYSDVYKLFYERCGFNVTDISAPNGLLQFKSGESKDIRIEAYDYKKNKAEINFSLKYIAGLPQTASQDVKKMDCSVEHALNMKELKVVLPESCMASPFAWDYTSLSKSHPTELLNIRLFNEKTALLNPYKIQFIVERHLANASKVYLHSILDKKPKTYTGAWTENILTFPKVKNFGLLSVRYDMQAPSISEAMKSQWSLSFTIHDDGSGIGAYNLYYNDQWRKVYYDEKSKRLISKILYSDRGKKFNIRLEVEDRVGNKNIFNKEIFL